MFDMPPERDAVRVFSLPKEPLVNQSTDSTFSKSPAKNVAEYSTVVIVKDNNISVWSNIMHIFVDVS